jgi:hypothetical protein
VQVSAITHFRDMSTAEMMASKHHFSEVIVRPFPPAKLTGFKDFYV